MSYFFLGGDGEDCGCDDGSCAPEGGAAETAAPEAGAPEADAGAEDAPEADAGAEEPEGGAM